MLKGVSLQAASVAVGTSALSGGTDTRVLFDDGGVLGESANLTFDKTNSILTLGADVKLVRSAANALALRNGTSAQSFLINRTYTDGSNYERLFVGADHAGTGITGFAVFAENTGTGSARSLYIGTTGSGSLAFVTNNNSRWTINSSGHFLTNSDNAYDIGASNATRPRHIYVGSNVYATAFVMARSGTSYASLQDDGDGNIRMYNGAASSFGLLKFGGTTSSFPALKRSSAALQARVADDSAYTDFYAKGVYSNEAAALVRANVALTSLAGANTATLTNAPAAGNPSDWIPIYVNGNRYAIPIWYSP